MAQENEKQMEKKAGCLNDKEVYHEIICGRISSNCLFCDIPMRKCEYWKARQFSQEKNKEDWKESLLDWGTK